MQLLTGFRDFYPEDCARRSYIFERWREVAQRYGFVQYDGPPLEELDLYTKKSGDEIVGQLYHFIDKGERAVAMRPEMTPTLARMVAANHRDYKKPMKWFSIPQVFRYERPQRGRLREHFQFNCDIIGEPGLEADIELIALCIDTLRNLGLSEKDFVVRLSDRRFWTDFLKSRNVPESDWYGILQAIDKSERETREKTTERLGTVADPVLKILSEGGECEQLDTVLAGLTTRGLGAFVKQDLSIVRGLAYYTGIVFEVFDRSEKLRAIAAGGRYDDLLLNLGGVDLPALGFGMGDVVLGELIASIPNAAEKMKSHVAQKSALQIYVVIAKEERRPDAMAAVQQMREHGFSVDFSHGALKVGKQFQNAEQLNAHIAVLFGDEWPQIKLKVLSTRAEQLVPNESLLNRLPEILNLK